MVLLVLSNVQHFVIPWTLAHQAPLFMEFSRQEYCSRFTFSDSEIELTSLASPGLADSLPLHHLGNPYITYIPSI